MAIPSFTNTETEREMEDYLDRRIGAIPYFQSHPHHFGRYPLPNDHLHRSVNWALVDKGKKKTVILFHHHDTVDLEDYGPLAPIALDSEALVQALKGIDFRSEMQEDLNSGQWQFGRGSCDMKAALALQLGVLEAYASDPDGGQVNLLYLSVGDEESYSRGMRGALGLLCQLKDEFDLDYVLAVDSEPFEAGSDKEKVLHIGTVGKLMPVVVVQGVLSHMKEPLKGINALSLLIAVASKLDLHPDLSDHALGERSPLPSWSYLRDLKDQYDVSTVLHAAGYFSVLHLKKTPQELLQRIKELSQEAVDQFYVKYLSLQDQAGQEHVISQPRVISYQELLDRCQKKEGFLSFQEQCEQRAYQDFLSGVSYQTIAIQQIQSFLEFLSEKNPLVVIGFAPPYYPSMNCRSLPNTSLKIDNLIDDYRYYLASRGLSLKVEEYFMGICDTSYCALERELESYQVVLDSLAIPSQVYELDLANIAQIQVPAVNLGPWGKELHQRGERVFREDLLDTIPCYLFGLLYRFDELL
ncbi:M20/M25/M40 family metallo-hydrolase [Streptococcus koreensis]|uniref:M20/M25/M40 family metallo-hydrolase n=1 Tax=Streptococcus koreensis TaxID=2382163 RepID=A0ABM6ZBT3_9STRE|nr:M20/M25/M40 family metallo-hydrolase [Streptococcus koreensis]AYF94940.1 M20/M25/M40 family metallo-hydrolase [Streptococcus koreensis]